MDDRQIPRQLLRGGTRREFPSARPLLRLALAAVLCASCCGCGVGALIGGAVVGAMAALDDGSSSSGPAGVPAAVNLVQAPRREQIRASAREGGGAILVPLGIFVTDGVDPDDVTVQYSREIDDEWRDASVTPSENQIEYIWDAGRDLQRDAELDLQEETDRVRVRAFLRNDDPESVEPTVFFVVGNSKPSVKFLPALTPAEPGGDHVISIQILDAEDDPVHLLPLEYCTGDNCGDRMDTEWKPLCGGEDVCSGVFEGTISPENRDQIDVTWRSNLLEKDFQQQNVTATIRLRAHDDFGLEVEDHLRNLEVRNNTLPRVEIVGSGVSERDQSFELPILFDAFESDSCDPQETPDCSGGYQSVAVVVQYKLEEDEVFEPLPDRFEPRWFDPRAEGFADPESEEARRLLRVATPHPRGAVTGLRASPGGVRHVFLWDSARDLPPFAADSPVELKMTPYDEAKGTFGKNSLVVDNGLYPDEELQTLVPVGPIGGIATGDLNRDGRADQVYSLTGSRELLVCLADDAGPSREGSEQCLPPLRIDDEAEFVSPTELELCHLNDDSLYDLAVLDRNCPVASCDERRGKVHVYYGIESERFLEKAPFVLETGEDARSLCAGDFDGLPGMDLAVSNHDEADMTFFLNTGFGAGADPFRSVRICLADLVAGVCPDPDEVPAAEPRRPGLLTCADFDGDGLDEIAVRLRTGNEVAILNWKTSNDLVSGNVTRTALVVTGPNSVTTADFDADGRLDLAVGSETGSVVLFRNISEAGSDAISFTPMAEFELGDVVEQIRVAPLPGPGEFLVATITGKDGGAAELLRGVFRNGEDAPAVELASIKTVPVTLPGASTDLPAALAAHDCDGDSIPDVLVGGQEGSLFLRGEGPGSLAPRLSQRVDLSEVDQIQVLRREERPDGFVALRLHQNADTRALEYDVSVFLEDALRGFVRRWVSPRRVITQIETFLAVVETTDDEHSTVIAVSHPDGIDVFTERQGESSIEFDLTPKPPQPDKLGTGQIVLGDFSESGGMQLIELVPIETIRPSTLFLRDIVSPGGDVPRSDRDERGLPVEIDFLEAHLLGGDLNGDGRSDLVILHSEGAEIRLQLKGKAWPDSFAESQGVTGLREQVAPVDLTDVNADGTLDLVVMGRSPKRLLVFRSTGDETELFPDAPVVLNLEDSVDNVVLNDFSNDKRADVVLSRQSDRDPRDAILNLIYQHADGSFPERPSRSITLSGFLLNPQLRGDVLMDVGDVTKDARAELVVYGPKARRTWILKSR